MTIGHKEVDGLQEYEETGKVEMFTGESIEVSEGEQIFTCIADSRGLLSSVGLPLAGMELLLSFICRSLKSLRRAQSRKRKERTLKIRSIRLRQN